MTKAIYRRVPVLIREAQPEDVNPWGISFLRMFDMSNDSHLFRTREQLEQAGYQLEGNIFFRSITSDRGVYRDVFLPLYEAKMIHQFDHRWATYDGDTVRDLSDKEKQYLNLVVIPRYWVDKKEIVDTLNYSQDWLVIFRNVARSTDERTAIFSLCPLVGVGNREASDLRTRLKKGRIGAIV